MLGRHSSSSDGSPPPGRALATPPPPRTGPPSVLVLACKRGRLDLVRAALRRPDVDVDETNFVGATPLLLACAHGFLEIARALLHAGADATQPDASGLMPIEHIKHTPLARLQACRRRPPAAAPPAGGEGGEGGGAGHA